MLDKAAEIHRQMLVGGEWVDSINGETIAVENPGNRTTLGYVPRGDAEDVDRAVRAAAAAFEPWSQVISKALAPWIAVQVLSATTAMPLEISKT